MRWIMAALWLLIPTARALAARPQETGSIRGSVTNADFGEVLSEVKVQIVETRQQAVTDASGSFVINEVAPGTYTVVFAKSGFSRVARTGVTVLGGDLTDLDVEMEQRLVALEPFVAEPALNLFEGSIADGDMMRFETPSVLDVITAETFKNIGVNSVDDALAAVPGASVANDATAVIRGLPDRYVPSLVNGVRMPSANEDKRAVELDQYPTAVVRSIAVSKTFTPDRQGDASGGQVDVLLKSIPDESIFNFSLSSSYNTQVTNEDSFLSYADGGIGGLGREANRRRPQLDRLGEDWEGAVGVGPGVAPRDYRMNAAVGDTIEYDNGWRLGGFLSLFYERDSTFFNNGIDDQRWIRAQDNGALTPLIGGSDQLLQTSLFDVTRASQLVQWGGTAAAGFETDYHKLSMQYLYSHTAEDVAQIGEDTRGKLFYFPDYDPDDPAHPGNQSAQTPNPLDPNGPALSTPGFDTAPYIRSQLLEYTERTTGSFQLSGEHEFPMEDFQLGESFTFTTPKLTWTGAASFADFDQPDRRLFGTVHFAPTFTPALDPNFPPPFNQDQLEPARYEFLQAVLAAGIGNLQRGFKTIEEDSKQISINLEFPFTQWNDNEGYLKFGLFEDNVDRTFDLDSFTNFNDPNSSFEAPFGQLWSDVWNQQTHPITGLDIEVDYEASIDISAFYGMMDLPLTDSFKLVGGARVERTDTSVILDPEEGAFWVPPSEVPTQTTLNPGDGDAVFSQRDILPALTAIYEVTPEITLRGAYSRTIARQTFKELVPVIQQEFLGAPLFIGNPELELAGLENFDLRVDYRPTGTSLLSASLFHKNVDNPIEIIQRTASFDFTTPVNYPEGELSGVELEARQSLGFLSDRLSGVTVGANATFIDSEVTFPEVELAAIQGTGVGFNETTRDATNAPEHLYNLFLTYNIADTGTQLSAFYTVQGDTLVVGDSAGLNEYIPAVYQREFGTLNLTLAQQLTRHINLRIGARNLTNPEIEEVYRSSLLPGDVTRTRFTRGIEYSIGLSASFNF